DKKGKLVKLGDCSVYSGRNLGEEHQQLVYRIMPSRQPQQTLRKIHQILQQLVTASGLRSTFLHPEFILDHDGLKLMEINVRIGGFRAEMMKYTAHIDLTELAVDLALGKKLPTSIDYHQSCTAVEIWETTS